jgi:hypothetical protein
MMKEEINPLGISMKKNGEQNTPCMGKVLQEIKDDVIELNACDKAEDFKGKKRKENQVYYVHQERSGRESRW